MTKSTVSDYNKQDRQKLRKEEYRKEAVQRAQAESIRLINEANPQEAYLTLKKLEAFAQAANGQATKIIIPSEIQAVAGLASSVVETAKETK